MNNIICINESKKLALAAKYILQNREYIEEYSECKTSYGSTIIDCIRSCLENFDSRVGLYAACPQAYDLFEGLFNSVISEYHKVNLTNFSFRHDFGNPADLMDLPLRYDDKIISTRIRIARSVSNYPMAALLTSRQRLELESIFKEVFSSLSGDLAGVYKSLSEISPEEKEYLIKKHILFNDAKDKFLRSAGAYNDWPNVRGIFISYDSNLIIWCNEEDHLRIISMQKGANLKQVYDRLVRCVNIIESQIEFVMHKKFGYLTFCPTNIGTTLRASVHIRLPKISASGKLKQICDVMNLQIRGTNGEFSEVINGIYDISNMQRLGFTEWDLISNLYKSIANLLNYEEDY